MRCGEGVGDEMDSPNQQRLVTPGPLSDGPSSKVARQTVLKPPSIIQLTSTFYLERLRPS
jgi:hypothetical protein